MFFTPALSLPRSRAPTNNPAVSNVTPPPSRAVFTEARLKPHHFSSSSILQGGRELPKSAFLLRGRKYLLPKTRRPFPDVEFKGIKSSPSIQQPVKRRWTRLAASQWESNEASEDLTRTVE